MKASYFIGYVLIRCLGVLPYRLLYTLGFMVGQLYWQLGKRDRRIATRNMQLCFPHLSEEEQLALAKRSLVNTAINVFESMWAWHYRYNVTSKQIREVEGLEHFKEAEAGSSGVVYVLGHFGHWEIMGDYFGHHCDNPAFLGRAFGIPILDNYIKAGRERSGGTIYPCTKDGLTQLYTATSQGRSTALLADQEASKQYGLFAPLFGVDAMTSLLVQDIMAKTGATVVMTALQRLPKGKGFKLTFFKPDADLFSKDLQVATKGLNRSYEQLINIDPAQYTWNYKRFKTRPDNESGLY